MHMPTKEYQGATLTFAGEDGEQVTVNNVTLTAVTMEDSKPKAIETLEDAARYAYGVSETRKEIEKIKAVATAEISRWQEQIQAVEDWQEEVLNPLMDKLAYFNMLLTNYHADQFYNAENEKAQAKLKSIKLPYGITLASKEQATKIEVVDDAALLSYATENNMIDTPKPKAKWADIKKGLQAHEDGRVFDSNGEEVSFAKAVPQERKFEVR